MRRKREYLFPFLCPLKERPPCFARCNSLPKACRKAQLFEWYMPFFAKSLSLKRLCFRFLRRFCIRRSQQYPQGKLSVKRTLRKCRLKRLCSRNQAQAGFLLLPRKRALTHSLQLTLTAKLCRLFALRISARARVQQEVRGLNRLRRLCRKATVLQGRPGNRRNNMSPLSL